MRICQEYNLVFVSTPKSGSHTGWKLMDENFSINKKGMHCNIVPQFATNYNAFTIIRNPYDRAVSVWNSLINAGLTEKFAVPKKDREFMLNVLKSDKFDIFCRFLANNKKPLPEHYKWLTEPQTRYHSKTNLKNLIFFKLEELNKLEQWLFEVTNVTIKRIPHELKREHKSWEELMTEENKVNIEKWAKEDFTNFKYSPIV